MKHYILYLGSFGNDEPRARIRSDFYPYHWEYYMGGFRLVIKH